MQRLINGFLFSAILFLPVLATASTLTIVNPDFSTPAIPCTSLDYVYQGSGTCSSETGGGNPFPQDNLNAVSGVGWTFGAAGDGLTGPGTAFNPPSFTSLPFNQAAFLQGDGAEVSQSIAGFSSGQEYALTFYLGSRNSPAGVGNDGDQTVEAIINGSIVGTYVLTNGAPFTFETSLFTGSLNGSETLEFEGLATGDHTAFLSGVSIASVPEPAYLPLLTAGLLGLCALLIRARRKSAN